MSPDGAANEAGARSRGSRTPSSEPRFTATDENAYIIPLCAVFRRHLRKEGQKFTPERAQVLDAIIQMNRVFEPDELRQTMRDRGLKVSKATIYRTLRLLQEARLIEQVAISPKQVHYRVAYGEPPQDQMVCIGTGQILHFAAPELVALRKRVAEEHGWSAVGHRFQIFAVSPEAEEGDPEDAADSVRKDAADAGDDADGDD
ncbi:MAG: Fur family transcriptional regulator [Planctomycetota bacterium]